MIICVNSHPFGECGSKPKILLRDSGFIVKYNPFKKKLTEEDIIAVSKEAHGIIAGTEPYTKKALAEFKNLKVISRVGAGFDSVDLDYCRKHGITVTYTPGAPTQGVAEFTLGFIIGLLRNSFSARDKLKSGVWEKQIGTLVSENIIGILGVGRIGKKVIELLAPFNPTIYGCDIKPDYDFGRKYNINWVSHADLYESCSLVSIHIPLNEMNQHFISDNEIALMKNGIYLINTARGKIVDELAILRGLDSGKIKKFAADVFEKEPYSGPLINHPDVICTPHIAAAAYKTRFLMELGATEDCIRVLSEQAPLNMIS